MKSLKSALQRLMARFHCEPFCFQLRTVKMVDYWRKHKRTKALMIHWMIRWLDKNNDLEIMDSGFAGQATGKLSTGAVFAPSYGDERVWRLPRLIRVATNPQNRFTRARNQLHLLLTESTKMPTRPS